MSQKLRLACDACHQAKIKCSRGQPCADCQRSGDTCRYSPCNRVGRPRGSKSKGLTAEIGGIQIVRHVKDTQRDDLSASAQPADSATQDSSMSEEWPAGYDDLFALRGSFSASDITDIQSTFSANLHAPGDTGVSNQHPSVFPDLWTDPDPRALECACALRSADLLCQMRHADNGRKGNRLSADVFLGNVAKAAKHSETLMGCTWCQKSGIGTALASLLLSAMCMEVLTEQIEALDQQETRAGPLVGHASPWAIPIRIGQFESNGDESRLLVTSIIDSSVRKIELACRWMRSVAAAHAKAAEGSPMSEGTGSYGPQDYSMGIDGSVGGFAGTEYASPTADNAEVLARLNKLLDDVERALHARSSSR